MEVLGFAQGSPPGVSAKSVEASGRFVKAGEDNGYRIDKQVTTEFIADGGNASAGWRSHKSPPE